MLTDRSNLRTLFSALTSVGLLQGVSLGTGFATLVVIGRTSGASELGDFAFITSAVFLCSNLAALGFGQAALSDYARLSRFSWGQRAIKQQMKSTLSVTVFMSALTCLLIGAILMATDVSPALFWGTVAWSFVCPILVFTGDQARALGYVRLGAILSTGGVNISPIASSLALAAVLLLPKEHFTAVELATWSLFVGGALTLLILSPNVFGNLITFLRLKSRYSPRSLFLKSLPFAATRVTPIYQSGDVVLVGLIASPELTGLYSAAARLAAIVSFPLTLLVKTATPTIASLWASHSLRKLRSYIFRLLLISALATLAIATPLLASPEQILDLIFGSTLIDAAPYLLVLTAGRLISGCCGPTGAVITAMGDGQALARSIVYTASLALSLGAVASTTHGAIGVAWVFAIALVFQNAFQLRHLYPKLTR